MAGKDLSEHYISRWLRKFFLPAYNVEDLVDEVQAWTPEMLVEVSRFGKSLDKIASLELQDRVNKGLHGLSRE